MKWVCGSWLCYAIHLSLLGFFFYFCLRSNLKSHISWNQYINNMVAINRLRPIILLYTSLWAKRQFLRYFLHIISIHINLYKQYKVIQRDGNSKSNIGDIKFCFDLFLMLIERVLNRSTCHHYYISPPVRVVVLLIIVFYYAMAILFRF